MLKEILTTCIVTTLMFAKQTEAKKGEETEVHVSDASVLPLIRETFDHGGGRYLVTADADNTSLKMLLDTGAKYSSISHGKELADYKVNGYVATVSLTGSMERMNTVVLKEFRLGNIRLANHRIGKGKSSNPNLLGMSTLSGLCFAINSKALELRLQRDCILRKAQPLVSVTNAFIGVRVNMEGNQHLMVVDTGASLSILNRSLVESLSVKKLQENAVVMDSSGEEFMSPIYLLPTLEIGNEVFENIKFVAADLSNLPANAGERLDGILGFNVINLANWTFDQQKHLYFVESN